MNKSQFPFNLPTIGPMGVVHSGSFTGMTPVQQAAMLQQEQQMMDALSSPFDADIEQEFAKGGSIPERYKNMGFSKVGVKKKSTRPGKKWMVLAKKGDQYKVVHGGDSKMKDFSQHGSEKRKDRFWDRMGGKDSAKANDQFSPLYWHKKFGTWQQGGQTFNEDSQDFYAAGGGIDNPGFRALPPAVQQNIIANMASGGENKPTNPELWSRAKAAAKAKYDVYPSAYANGYAAKWYKQHGGGWRKAEYGAEMYMDGGQPCFECGGRVKYADGGWIQNAVDRMKAKGTVGSFTEQAKRAGFDSALAYAKHIKKNPGNVSDTTKKRAQFVLNTNQAAYGKQVPMYQGLGPSQVSSTSGMGNIFMQDLNNPFEAPVFQPAPQQAAAQPSTNSPIAASYFSRIPTTSGMGNIYFQDLQTEDLLNNPYGAYQKNVEATLNTNPNQEQTTQAEEKEKGNWWKTWGPTVEDMGLSALQGIARGVNNRRLEPWFNRQTAADNTFEAMNQGIADRGDYDVNYGSFRPDQMGFKNDAMYWNPNINVARTPMFAQEGGNLAIADEDILAELERLGVPFEIVDDNG